MNVAERTHQTNIAMGLLEGVVIDILREVEESDKESISIYELSTRAGFSPFGCDDVYVMRYVVKELMVRGAVKTTPDDMRQMRRWTIALA